MFFSFFKSKIFRGKNPLSFPISESAIRPELSSPVCFRNMKISKTLQNSLFLFIFLFFFAEKKCYPLSFPILGERDSTRALQSSPFEISEGYPERDTRTNEQTNGNPCV